MAALRGGVKRGSAGHCSADDDRRSVLSPQHVTGSSKKREPRPISRRNSLTGFGGSAVSGAGRSGGMEKTSRAGATSQEESRRKDGKNGRDRGDETEEESPAHRSFSLSEPPVFVRPTRRMMHSHRR